MVRKFFATLVLLFATFVLPPLILAESFADSFISVDSLQQRVIPQSYLSVTNVIAEQFGTDPISIKTFASRIRTALPPEEYGAVLNGVAESPSMHQLKKKLLEAVPGIVARLPLCEAMDAANTQFRFCKPAGLTREQTAIITSRVTDTIQKEVPEDLAVSSPQVQEMIRTFSAGAPHLKVAILFFTIFSGGLIMLIIFSPLSKAFIWLGVMFFSLAAGVAAFLFSLQKFPELIGFLKDITDAQRALVANLVALPAWYLQLWTFFLCAGGVLTMGIGLMLRSHNKKHI